MSDRLNSLKGVYLCMYVHIYINISMRFRVWGLNSLKGGYKRDCIVE